LAERALILLKPQFLGDAVMATPMIDATVESGMEAIVMCGPAVEQLLSDRQNRVRFARGEKIAGFRPVLQAARSLRALRADKVYLVNRSFRSALAARLSGIPKRIGHRTEGRAFLLTQSIAYDEAKFEAECYLDLLRCEGLDAVASMPKLEVNPVSIGVDFGLQPGARYVEKQVPLATMATVARELVARGYAGAIFGGPDEKDAAAAFSNLAGVPLVNRVGFGSILETAGEMAGLRVMIGSDTGLMHVAAASGCPTVTVFGPNPASKWGHRYFPHEVIEAPGGQVGAVRAEAILEAAERALCTVGKGPTP